jgi:hypothetical protein
MRISVLLHGAAFLLAAVAPALAFGQFQLPSNEELKMTSDPKAPGADAVYLEMSEVDNPRLGFRTYHARIKVLTEKGKELATVAASYLKGDTQIREIHGRTIHPDGTVILLTVKPEDLLSEKRGDIERKRKVFTLPDVEVGSILEYSYDLQYHDDVSPDPPHWEIQKPYFVHIAHYRFTTGCDVIWSGRLPQGVDVKKSISGTYSVDLTDVPPIPNEEWMPPIGSFFYEVSFLCAGVQDTTDFWREEGKAWSKEVDEFAEQSKVIKAAVAGLIATGDSDLDKAKKLYAAVQTVDNTDYSRRKTESERQQLKLKEEKHAGDTWVQKSGGSNALALLYLAMLRAAGLKAYAVEVVDREKGIFDPEYISTDQLDSVLIILDMGGKHILLDPGEKMCPFQTVNWRHSLAAGIGQSAQGPSFTTTPAQEYANNIVRRTGILTLDGKGGVKGQLQITMTGQEALRWRQTALENDETEVKKEFDVELEAIAPDGTHAHVDHFEAISDPNANLIAVVNINGTLGASTAKRLVIPSFFFETRGHIPFVNEERRLEPVDMHYGDRITDQITYRLPAGFTVEGAPQDVNLSWPNHAFFVAKSLTQSGQVTVAQTLSRALTLAKPDEYQDLRGFYQKVAAADQEQIVLSAAAAKGN